MYTHWIYIAFVQLRKQFYKIKKNRNLDRYSRIESLKNEFITFRRFCDAIDEYNTIHESCVVVWIQEVFDDMLDKSQNNTLKYYIY